MCTNLYGGIPKSYDACTLVHAFVANRLDYCSSLYAGLPACRLGCLDRVLRSAACLIGAIPKFGHVSEYMLDVLRWLPAEQRISYRIASLVWRCLLGLAHLYLRELCCPLISAMSSRCFAHLNRVFSWSRLPVPPLSRAALFPWWIPRSGMGSLLNFGCCLEPCHLRFFSP